MKNWSRYKLDENLKIISEEIKKTLRSSNINYEQAYLVLSIVNDDLLEEQRQNKLGN